MRSIDQTPQWILLFVSLLTTALIGGLDYITGYEFSFSVFYLLPIALTAWGLGLSAGLLMSLISACVWIIANMLAGVSYSQQLTLYWNALTRAGFFIIVTLLIVELHRQLTTERSNARIDYLTGAINRRAFYDISLREIQRATRYKHPFTLVYIDIDNFKFINDHFGHQVGDELLKTITEILQQNTRNCDFVSRLGGDEFAVLLPETDRIGAKTFMSRMHNECTQEMNKRKWPITFSIGVITFLNAPKDIDQMINLGDHLMYQVKQTSKNAISYAVYMGNDGQPYEIG